MDWQPTSRKERIHKARIVACSPIETRPNRQVRVPLPHQLRRRRNPPPVLRSPSVFSRLPPPHLRPRPATAAPIPSSPPLARNHPAVAVAATTVTRPSRPRRRLCGHIAPSPPRARAHLVPATAGARLSRSPGRGSPLPPPAVARFSSGGRPTSTKETHRQ
uniref:Uncharacterized protein n=1 Tax=Leersia perrieri TaxID=77586 RepID=A0A0D9XN20_9ORYZ